MAPKTKPTFHYTPHIADAIKALKERSGSSVPAIQKWLAANVKGLPAGWEKKVSVIVKQMAKAGKLVKVKASYKLGEALKKPAPKPKKVVKKPAAKKPAAKKVVKKAAAKKPAAKKEGEAKPKATKPKAAKKPAAAKPKAAKKPAAAKPKAAKPAAKKTPAKKAAPKVKKTTATKKAAPKK